jgi:carnitine O-acetyltransferase
MHAKSSLILNSEPAKDPLNSVSDPKIEPIRKLEWTVDDVIKTRLGQAQIFIDKTVGDSDVEIFHYNGYGGDFIKKYGKLYLNKAKVSPDAFNQMCIQLAFFRVHGYCAGVYETAATRKFLHGRTETTRSHSMEQKQFVEIFQSNKPVQQKYLAFQKACTKHVEYIKIASDGKGCDRHLFGLQRVMKKGETHELFTHPVFAKSSKWQLSTSALFPSENLPGTGFGTVYPDGYGMNYVIMKDFIKFGIESKYSCNETNTRKFVIALEGVYEDMKAMCESVSAIQSKL